MQPILRIKILQLALALSALFGYLEWGEGQHQFLFQTLVTLFSKGWQDPVSVAHPLPSFPLSGYFFGTAIAAKTSQQTTYLFWDGVVGPTHGLAAGHRNLECLENPSISNSFLGIDGIYDQST